MTLSVQSSVVGHQSYRANNSSSASNAPWTRVALGEALLLLACPALALAGQGLQRVLRRADLAEALATVLAAALATALWFTRGAWALLPA